jgi:hypothetical protein
VVGSAVGGLLDTIVDGTTGLLVPPRSPYAAALAVRGLITSPQLRAAMGQAGRRRVAERFTWATIAEQTERVYESVRTRSRLRLVGAGSTRHPVPVPVPAPRRAPLPTGSSAALPAAAVLGTSTSGGRR